MSTAPGDARIAAVVVTFESAAVIESCLRDLLAGAPRRGLDVTVVDNASRDDGAARAAALLGAERVVRLPVNRGFAAGVNAVLRDFRGTHLAVVNPDVMMAPGTLDRLADALDAHPEAALMAPRVRGADGHFEPTVGVFPTLERERAHAQMLDRLLGRPARRAEFPARAARVDWASGCAWMLRGAAIHQTGALDEGYFMYFEDVDYCRRLRTAGWEVWATPDVEVVHARGGGSTRSAELPADGGRAMLRYFERHHPEVPRREVARVLAGGWRLRRTLHGVRAAFGDVRSAQLARRYARALAEITEPAAARD